MPAALAERVLADRVLADRRPQPYPQTLAGWAMPTTRPAAPPAQRRRPAVTWFAAAASVLLIAGVSWWLYRGHPATVASLADARAELLASAGDATRLDWHAVRRDPRADSIPPQIDTTSQITTIDNEHPKHPNSTPPNLSAIVTQVFF